MFKRLRIKKTSIRVKLIAFYALMTFVYYYITFSIISGISSLEANHFTGFIRENLGISLFSAVVFLSTLRLNKWTFVLNLCLYGYILAQIISLLSANVDKFTLISLFIVSFAMILNLIILKGELAKACYNSKYSSKDIEASHKYPVRVEILNAKEELVSNALVTNIDVYSCFLRVGKELPKKIVLRFYLSSISIDVKGIVVSSFFDGYGVEFKDQKMSSSWAKVYDYLNGRGFVDA